MTPQPRIRRRLASTVALSGPAVLFTLLLILVACGNDDSDAGAATPDATAAPSVAVEAGEDDGESEVPDALEELASDAGSATVTIGDATYEFSLAGTMTIEGTTYVGRCQSLFGMIAGSGFATDGRDITVDMEVPPVDWETYEDDRFDPPSVEVEDNVANAKWAANAGDEFSEGSAIGEYEQDATTASGSATFVNEWAPDSEPVEGSFAIDCAG